MRKSSRQGGSRVVGIEFDHKWTDVRMVESALDQDRAGGPMTGRAETDAGLLPLVVDLDFTLLRTASLWEQFTALVFRKPLDAVRALMSLPAGRARFKARLNALGGIDAASLPYRQELVDYLRDEK